MFREIICTMIGSIIGLSIMWWLLTRSLRRRIASLEDGQKTTLRALNSGTAIMRALVCQANGGHYFKFVGRTGCVPHTWYETFTFGCDCGTRIDKHHTELSTEERRAIKALGIPLPPKDS